MKWAEVLDTWANGGILAYPDTIKQPFIWRGSKISSDENSTFKEEFIIEPMLNVEQDYSAFSQHINKSKSKHVINFMNLSRDTILVVPMPKKTKNFSNIKEFIDNSSLAQQKALWKCVARMSRKLLKKNKYIWISTHGFGVPYLHVRISAAPKYYGNSKLSK
jgi:hypothetical protein